MSHSPQPPEVTAQLKELRALLDTMECPEMRKQDVGWLARNLQIRNAEHPNFPRARELIKELLL